ncbi:HAD family hydrolase [Verminephrobacter eiseniae]|uniref:HAD-superfamily hydrolase, subfamily IA, variant 3 n=1 Tax=Verminephrobacter eiseniae (strain EF01-2) TaxID=391735 RepID=A1WN82_VEREI|nr:HAD-IA family hydrolase [Verminephrobacter eiseniae]ABM59089.1 HAD-superfamily hydrolase, subfamily IA, variant 3 [Verminephrobacter eiseniae EF01-2]MCW5284636.1 HAD family hydrolase [Verminephrobacter eiseniae]MCW5302343.1 HAD family hydrolase [Verminephrobacter eiseniae]MCW8179104.1 HAD family hydrolase [Verminephrobacter eiseniae]MCW8190283.1 HAD family hydrolase [Verminephrobacter eiseniae]
MTEAVLFDLDGTLADTSGDLAAATCDALAAVGLPSPEPHTLHAYGSRGGRGMLRAGWSGDLDDALFQRAFTVFLERYALRMYESTVLFDGVGACLEQLARGGRRWGIVTNKRERYTRPLVKHLGFQPEVLVCGDMVPQSKPAPDSLLAAAAALGHAPAECVYVGDDGKDVIAAAAAGMTSVAALYGYSVRLNHPGLKGADAEIGTLRALPSVLKDLAQRKS